MTKKLIALDVFDTMVGMPVRTPLWKDWMDYVSAKACISPQHLRHEILTTPSTLAMLHNKYIGEDVPEGMLEELSAEKRSAFLYDDVEIFVHKAKALGHTVALISNLGADYVGTVKKLVPERDFSGCYYSCYDGMLKPDALYYSKVAKEQNFAPEDCIMIGNSEKNDIKGAEDCGWTGKLISRAEHKPNAVSSLEELDYLLN